MQGILGAPPHLGPALLLTWVRARRALPQLGDTGHSIAALLLRYSPVNKLARTEQRLYSLRGLY